MTRSTSDQELMQRRVQRHEAHVDSTYATFLRHLSQLGSMEVEVAECAAISVLSALERRILPKEARQLEAQLPRKLVEFLPPPDKRPARPHRFGREEFLQTVADDLKKSPEEVEPLVRLVIRVFREQISEGEAEDVASNLPPDLRALWRLEQ
jgi:uncharacterized protein (DUF2267 family)